MNLKDVVGRLELWKGWNDSYNKWVPKFIQEASTKSNYLDWDQDTFYEFFEQARDQCVSSLQQGYFSNLEKDRIKQNWSQIGPLLKQVADSQDEMQLDVYKAIDKEIRKHTTQHRRASVNRLIASLQPKLLCTIVNEGKLNLLIDILNQKMDNCSITKTNNWFINSHEVLNYFVTELNRPAMEIMTLPWQTYAHFTIDSNSQDQSNNMDDEDTNEPSKTMNDLQVILYGPPGTGKTYNTINRAIKIVDKNYPFGSKTRKEVADHFRSLLYDEERNPEGQIVFTTFHQSMTYEDFIEGIKPKMNEDIDDQSEESTGSTADIEYEVKDGIFKNIVKLANKSTKNTISFETLWDRYISTLRELTEEKIFTSISSELKLESLEPNGNSINVRFKKSWNPEEPEGTRAFIVSKNMIERLFDGKVDGSDENKRGRTDVSKLVGKGRATHIYSVYKDFYAFALQNGAFTTGERLNYVIIIDEINRGNVSSIFGELITLIEKDKRKGEDNELSVVLPYSRDSFVIPTNLHIIGTMNTADRSVEALDTALRRRFTFKEMLPNPIIIGKDGAANATNGVIHSGTENEIDLIHLLKVINDRIEILVDRDHTIGHAYLMDVDSKEKLKHAFENKIIPLLQEYFYGDYRKMEMVIGSDFFDQDKLKRSGDIFAKTSNSINVETGVYQFKQFDSEDFDIIDAVRVLLNKPKKSEAIQPVDATANN